MEFMNREVNDTILGLADRIDDVLGLYAKTVSDRFTDEAGRHIFRVTGRGSYPNPAHYDIRYGIEDKKLGRIEIVPISEIAKQKLTTEIVESIRMESGLK